MRVNKLSKRYIPEHYIGGMQKKHTRWSMKMRYKQKKEQDDTLTAKKPIKATRHEY